MVMWTDQQKRAIEIKDNNILVSAAAGSGKTATLIERIISILSDPLLDVKTENVMVTTFTNAAAGEIRERIRSALLQKVKENPEDQYIKKQYRNISQASIFTLHSFCADVIRKHSSLISLDPYFSVLDQTLGERYLDDAIKRCMEAYLSEDNQDFANMLSTLGYGRNFNSFIDLLKDTYYTIKSYPDYEKWLYEKVEETLLDKHDIFASTYGIEILNMLTDNFNLLKDFIENTQDFLGSGDEQEHYEEALLSDLEFLDEIELSLNKKSWDQLYNFILEIRDKKFKNLPRKKPHFEEEMVDMVKTSRQRVKDYIKLLDKEIYDNSQQIQKDCQYLYPTIKIFASMLIRVDKTYSEYKEKLKAIDFSDMEHMALKCLRAGAGDFYKNKFKHILIDEYQDFNYLQEEIINQIKRENNVFSVGDLKQSIYRFRNAQTAIFRNKAALYEQNLESGVRINLGHNFRSRSGVIDYVNLVFRGIMNKNLGEVDYDDNERLLQGATYYKASDNLYQPELVKIQYERNSLIQEYPHIDRIRAEAYVVAHKIKELINSKLPINNKTKGDLPIEYKDIVILLRATNPYGAIYADVLKKVGIPAHSDQTIEFLTEKSISDMYALLHVIDNPYQDIYLAQIMISSIYGFTEKDLSEIRNKESNLYNNLLGYMEENKLKEKIKNFTDDLNDMRDFFKINTLEKSIYYAMTKSGLFYIVKNNDLLKKFYTLSVESVKKGISDLPDFLEFLTSKKKKDLDIISDVMKNQAINSVKIMSIHKSKGLEFPVVILAAVHRNFNMVDIRKRVLIDKDLGIGSGYINLEKNTYHNHITKNVLSISLLKQNLSEEVRVLYVAMTRAKEKLVITGIDPNKTIYSYASEGKNYFDWILPNTPSEIVQGVGSDELLSIINNLEKEDNIYNKDNIVLPKEFDDLETLIERINFEYKYLEETTLNRKVSATELIKYQSKNYEIDDFYDRYRVANLNKPQFLNLLGTSKSASEIGTMVHKIMASIDLKKLKDPSYKQELKEKIIEENLYKAIEKFSQSSVYDLIDQSDFVYKEKVFFNPVNTSDYSLFNAHNLKKDHKVLIQGVIDCLCIKDNKAYIIDYKTDKIEKGKEIESAQKYKEQMTIYKDAVRNTMNIPVEKTIIYFFETNSFVDLEDY